MLTKKELGKYARQTMLSGFGTEGQEKLIEFVVLTAKANGASVDDLKSRAVNNWSEFIKAFEAWMSKQAPAKKEPANEKEIPTAPEMTAPAPAPTPVPASRPANVAGHQGPQVMPRYGMISGPGT